MSGYAWSGTKFPPLIEAGGWAMTLEVQRGARPLLGGGNSQASLLPLLLINLAYSTTSSSDCRDNLKMSNLESTYGAVAIYHEEC